MGDATRFARARALAEEAIAAAPADELVAIMRVAGTAEVLMEPGLDRGAARTTVSQLEPGAGPTRYHAAIARAFDTIGTRRGRIVLITDLQSSGWGAADAIALPDRVQVEVQDVGPMPPNAGITALDRVPDGIRVGLSSTGAARSVEVTVTRDDANIGSARVALPADGSAQAVFKDAGVSGIVWCSTRGPGSWQSSSRRRARGRPRPCMSGARSRPPRRRTSGRWRCGRPTAFATSATCPAPRWWWWSAPPASIAAAPRRWGALPSRAAACCSRSGRASTSTC
jgi:hypothetical protein